MASTDAIPVPRKNTAYRFYFAIRKPSDSTLITTWAGADSEVSLDGAAYSDCTNEATEIGTTGTGYIDLTSSEMNADCVLLKVTVTNTGSVPLVFALYPESAGDYRVADTQKVDVDTIKTNPVVNGGTVTFPTGATLASTTNITAATGVVLSGVTHTGAVIPTVTTLTGHTPQTGDTYSLANGAAGFVAIDNVVDAILDDTGTSGVLLSTTALGAIWNRLTSSLTTVGSIGKWILDNLTGDIYARLGAPAGASIAADIAAVKAETATIVVDTNELQTDWANGGRLDLILDARASQTSVDDLPTNAELATALATGVNVTQIDGSNLGTHGIGQFPADVRDWGGLGAAIAIDADNSYPSVAAMHIDANAYADIRAAIGMASANMDTQLGDLPTNSELATALAAADDAVLAAIAALNNLSAAQVNAELLDVLNVDTFGELAAPPAANSTLRDKLTWIFMCHRNLRTETATQRKLYADNGSTLVGTEAVSDNGTTFTKEKVV